MAVLHSLLEWDCELEKVFNLHFPHPWLDTLMLALSSTTLMWVLIGALTLAAIVTRSWGLGRFLGLAVLAVAITDTFCFRFLKPQFARVRPCHHVCAPRQITSCGTPHGFPSNHAANAATVATVVVSVFGGTTGIVASVLALGIGVSRLYLGAHYPSDVLAGFLVGILVALGVLAAARRWRRSKLGESPALC